MKTTNNFKTGLRKAWPFNNIKKSLVLNVLILTGITNAFQAQQDSITQPSWWIGVAAGANFNFYNGSTQKLNSDLTVPVPFHSGNGTGLYLGPLVEFHSPGSRWGAMFQAGYDSRKGSFKEIITPCNCPADLSTKLSYITVEPSVSFAPFKGNLYLYGGPRLAFNLDKSFTYHQKTNPDYPEQTTNPEIKGDLSDVNPILISMQIGMGYNIQLSSKDKKSKFVLAPYVSFQPYFGQSPRTIETWNVTTLRAGLAFKFGRGKLYTGPPIPVEKAEVGNPDTKFYVNSPKNIPIERRVRESFPLRNYVFFDIGSNQIPKRYVLLNKDQVKDFKENQLEVFKPKNLSGRSNRQMLAYYNVLNIVGDRMVKKPTITIKLVGSAEQGPEDGKAMAESVKKYLVEAFAIEPARINTEGRTNAKIPSEAAGNTKDLDLIAEGNRRVTIETVSPTLLMEFQSGSDAPLMPIEILGIQEAPLDSYVTFIVEGSKNLYKSWSLEVRDEKGNLQNFGPYTKDKVSLPGKTILGNRPEGDYKVTMVGNTKNGTTIRKETSVHMVLWSPPKDEEGMRYSVIYEFDESKSSALYEKYLTDVVTPKIPKDGTIIIHGYTDIIGDEDHNQKLSAARANDVKSIIESGLAKAVRTDVKIEIYGFGENESLAPFENKFPEERFYNRTVIIDIIPKK